MILKCFFTLIYLRHCFFFFSIDCLPCKPAPSKRVGCVDKTWAGNECILCSVTFCKDLAVPLRSRPKGQLLAAVPGAERESGLKTDKGEGLQGFSTIYSCYSNHLRKSHCMGRGAQKEGPGIITWAMGEHVQYRFNVTRLGFTADAGSSLCLQMKRQYAHVLCSAAALGRVWSTDLMAQWWGTVLRQHSLVK